MNIVPAFHGSPEGLNSGARRTLLELARRYREEGHAARVLTFDDMPRHLPPRAWPCSPSSSPSAAGRSPAGRRSTWSTAPRATPGRSRRRCRRAGGCLAPVAADAEGVLDILDDGVTGLVVPRRDVAALEAALARLLADRGFLDRLRRAAHAHAQGFSWQRCAGRRLELYERALRLRSGEPGHGRRRAAAPHPSADTLA